ncbi:uncharacterized protein LOC132796996 [Drosophila nasuta]|uniref:uncharacterized protein LOC132796996 n=1 Tax=Drosophila nasuta TaxID=42062 RepID=UPI00295E6B87|nr:uncharacterized protein LOC132796996 [Drosophila nasuta]
MQNMFKVNLFRHWMDSGYQKSCSFREERLRDYWDYVMEFSMGRYEKFSLMFCFVLGMSLFGAYCSIREYVHIYRYPNCTLSMSRPRRFNVFSSQMLRKARLCGALLMCHCWLLLVYGLLSMKPYFLLPWLFVNSIVLKLDILLWIVDLVTGRVQLQSKTLYAILRLICSLALVNCVRKVFDNAIKSNLVEAFRFFGLTR